MSLCTCVEDDYRCEWCTLRLRLAEVANERDEARANLATRDEYLTGIIAGLDCDDGCGCGKRHCVLDEEAECVTCRLTRQVREARAEVERLRAELAAVHAEANREARHASAEVERLRSEAGRYDCDFCEAHGRSGHATRLLEALRERCAAAVEFSLAGFSCVCSFRAAEAVRAVSLEGL